MTAWLGENGHIRVERTTPWARLQVQPPRVSSRTLVDVVGEEKLKERGSLVADDILALVAAVDAAQELLTEPGPALRRLLARSNQSPAPNA